VKHFIYIIYSKNSDRYYIGFTKELDVRLQRHNTHHKGYTGKSNDWELKHSEEYPSKTKALQREKELKKWKSRKRIEELISASNK